MVRLISSVMPRDLLSRLASSRIGRTRCTAGLFHGSVHMRQLPSTRLRASASATARGAHHAPPRPSIATVGGRFGMASVASWQDPGDRAIHRTQRVPRDRPVPVPVRARHVSSGLPSPAHTDLGGDTCGLSASARRRQPLCRPPVPDPTVRPAAHRGGPARAAAPRRCSPPRADAAPSERSDGPCPDWHTPSPGRSADRSNRRGPSPRHASGARQPARGSGAAP